MRNRVLFLSTSLVAMILVTQSASSSQSTLRFSNESEFGFGSVSGKGAAQSIMTKDGSFANVMSLSFNSGEGDSRYFINLGGRVTNDDNADYRSFSLTNFQFKLNNGAHSFSVGDTMGSLSQYSLSSALKGISYTLRGDGSWFQDMTLIYGLAVPRWDSLYSDKAVKSISRQAYGFGTSHRLTADWIGGIHYVQSSDSNRINAADPLYNGNVVGLTLAYEPFEGLSLTGESSYSRIKESPAANASTVVHNGNASRLSFRGEGEGLRLNIDYERVEPAFLTVLGSASVDREKVRAQWRQNYGKTTTAYYTMLWLHDNLDDKKPKTTHHYRPEVRLTQKQLFSRRYATGEVSWKFDLKNGTTTDTNHFLDFGYRDRIGPVDSDTRLGVASYTTSGGARRSSEYTVNTTFSTRHTMGTVVFRPNMHVGSRIAFDDLTDNYDHVFEASVGSGLDAPDMHLTSRIQIGLHTMNKDAGDDSSKGFTNLSLHYKPPVFAGVQDLSFFVRGTVNGFSSTDKTKNYSENSLVSGINFQY